MRQINGLIQWLIGTQVKKGVARNNSFLGSLVSELPRKTHILMARELASHKKEALVTIGPKSQKRRSTTTSDKGGALELTLTRHQIWI